MTQKPERICAILREDFHQEKLVILPLTYPDITIRNRSMAWSLSFQNEDSEQICLLKEQIANYNRYIEFLKTINGFEAAFNDQHGCIYRNYAIAQWGKDIADKIFAIPDFVFETQLKVRGNCLFAPELAPHYNAQINGENIDFFVGGTDDGYPKTNESETDFWLWNWMDDGRDLCYYLWQIFDSKGYLPEEIDTDNLVKTYNGFEVYDQHRYSMDGPDINLWRCLQILKDSNYLKIYELYPQTDNPWWHLRGTSHGTITLGVLSKSFFKNKVQKDKLKLVLSASEEEIRENKYILLDSHKRPRLSQKGGEFGGHYKLKIYGKLDCPSAKKFLEKGQYAQDRVFFSDEATAIAAGFRPCSICMKKEYKKWKEEQEFSNQKGENLDKGRKR